MSLGPIRRPYTTAEEPVPAEETEAEDSTSGSVWWAELSMGGVCCLAAAAIALARTSIGPLASVSVTYSTALVLLYLAVATGLGLTFLRSGARRAPPIGRWH